MTRFMAIILLIFSFCAQAQDERFIRRLLSGDLSGDAISIDKPKPHFRATSPMYEIDLNGDDRVEYIIVEKIDEEDWLHIHNYNRERIFSMKLIPKGWESDVYKINFRKISKDTKALLISYYEGHNQGENFISTARLYIISWDNDDFKSMASFRGPLLWEEYKNSKTHYHQRPYHVSLYDFDNDGIREIAVRHHLITRVLTYHMKGKWSSN